MRSTSIRSTPREQLICVFSDEQLNTGRSASETTSVTGPATTHGVINSRRVPIARAATESRHRARNDEMHPYAIHTTSPACHQLRREEGASREGWCIHHTTFRTTHDTRKRGLA